MPVPPKTIHVTVEKGHLLTLGERMYVESIELIRELVNNAYDADATEVYVTATPESIVIEDDGSGMDERGLTQFFTVGSEEKKVRSTSPRFGRRRIGQFGIGKFAALAAANRFQVESCKGRWIYTVVFDREAWEQSAGWELPISKDPATPLHHQGTRVVLTQLKRHFSAADMERYLRETVPMRAKRFSIFLNGKRITARTIPGRRFPIAFNTMYGTIEGEIIIAVKSDSVETPGIECRVKQVLVRRELFGVDRAPTAVWRRVTGEVNADFLSLTSGRNEFLRDAPEFKLFYQLVRSQLEKVLKDIKDESEVKNYQKIRAELQDVLSKIRQALQLHPELTPSGKVIARRRKRSPEIALSTTPGRTVPAGGEAAASPPLNQEGFGKGEKKPARVNSARPLPKPAVIKRMQLKKLGLAVAVVSLGVDGPEVVAQGNLIYLNSDYPLYQKLQHRRDQFELHLLRLITQEIVMMKKLRLSAREAFDWQGRLLTDAVCGPSAAVKPPSS